MCSIYFHMNHGTGRRERAIEEIRTPVLKNYEKKTGAPKADIYESFGRQRQMTSPGLFLLF